MAKDQGHVERPVAHSAALLTCALLVAGTVLGLSGIDLVLPAIPALPEALGGSTAEAQFVIATYVAGTAAGLLLFGWIGPRFGRRWTLAGSLALFALLSWLCGQTSDMDTLTALRFLQGTAGSAAAVFGPGIIRGLFSETGATKALGALGSIESLVPAGAPIVGAWLLTLGPWQLSFWVTAALAVLLALAFLFVGKAIPGVSRQTNPGRYRTLLTSPTFQRYAISQATTLGGLLVFVFGAPAVIVRSMGGSLDDFILMQVIGVACFIAASNSTGFIVARWGAERLILLGTALAALSALGLLTFALFGNGDPGWLPYLFAPMNLGLGLRGPPGFLRAIIAGGGDDDRAASLTILSITAVSAGGTAVLAPFVDQGLVALCLGVALIQLLGLALLLTTKPLPST